MEVLIFETSHPIQLTVVPLFKESLMYVTILKLAWSSIYGDVLIHDDLLYRVNFWRKVMMIFVQMKFYRTNIYLDHIFSQ